MGGYGMAVELAEKVKERTNGKFIIEVFQPNTLIKTSGVLDALRSGAIQMAASNGAYLAGTVPSGAVESISVGGALDATVFVPMLTETDWLKIVRDDYAKYGIHYIAPAPAAAMLLMGNFEANTVEELIKHKIAASGAKGDLIKLLGGTSVVVHSTDIYPALERKTIDAIIYSSYCLNTYKFHEVVKYVIWTEMQNPTFSNNICNLKAYQALPKEYQDILDEEGLKIAIRQLKGTNEMDDVARQTADKHGIKQITFKGEEAKKIRQGILKIWAAYSAKSENNAKLIKILRKYAGY
jgi:TRAP-type C4-dicarboxylate transport system substrate-binding protein